MMLRKLFVTLAFLGSLMIPAIPANAQGIATWQRTYPERTQPACTWIIAQWSDGTFSASAWECDAGQVAVRADNQRASRGYPQVADNGCTEYVSLWSDGSYSWVPFQCPAGIVYLKSQSRGVQPLIGAAIAPPGQPVAPPIIPVVPPANPPTNPPSGGTGRGVPPISLTACPATHPVKGNRGTNGNIYHVPGSSSYGNTQPEECFATAADAEAAGYRAPLN